MGNFSNDGDIPVPSLQDIIDHIQQQFEASPPSSLDDARRMASSFMEQANSAPQEDFGGLSPSQVFQLTRNGWLDEVVEMNSSLPLSSVRHSSMFHNCRLLLNAIARLGTCKATATGAFNRAIVEEIHPDFAMDSDYREYNLQKKHRNENDLPILPLMRRFLAIAGLLLHRKGTFSVTKKGKNLLQDGKAGELYTLLFRTVFTRVNLAVMDGLPENPEVQWTMGYSLYRFHSLSTEWTDIDDVCDELILPAVAENLEVRSWSKDPVFDFARIRILRNLERFGMVEFEPPKPLEPDKIFRKTELFNQFISFRLN